jgi:aspartate carbamoyltransferase catalytic subunit
MRLKHFYESQQLEPDILIDLFNGADQFRNNPSKTLEAKILASLFYEPSTRTRLSFESAMKRLGGDVLTTENAEEFSSASKGESLKDTIRVLSAYCDCIVIRHKQEGSAKEAASVSPVPIINAGDGKGQHPTQALLDLYTIYRESGNKLRSLKIAMVGDLAAGRTVRSLCYLLGKFSGYGTINGTEIIFVSPENLKMQEDIKTYLTKNKVSWKEDTNLNKVLPEVDFIYLTRIQKERISDQEYTQAKGKYILSEENLPLIKKTARLLHPLPHVEEIQLPIEIEQSDPRIAYFRQAENGLYIRMALLNHLMN